MDDLKKNWNEHYEELDTQVTDLKQSINGARRKYRTNSYPEQPEEKPKPSTSSSESFYLTALPKEFLEKQVERYKEALSLEKNVTKLANAERQRLEEDLMETKLLLEEERRRVNALKNEKDNLEGYVNALAEEMEQETSNLVSMKEQFETETKCIRRKSLSIKSTEDDDKDYVAKLIESLDVGKIPNTTDQLEAITDKLEMINNELKRISRAQAQLKRGMGSCLELQQSLQTEVDQLRKEFQRDRERRLAKKMQKKREAIEEVATRESSVQDLFSLTRGRNDESTFDKLLSGLEKNRLRPLRQELGNKDTEPELARHSSLSGLARRNNKNTQNPTPTAFPSLGISASDIFLGKASMNL